MDEDVEKLEEQIEQLKEDLFFAHTDLQTARTENIALKNFVQNIYESCEGMEDIELSLSDVLKNLKENIRVFSKDHQIRL